MATTIKEKYKIYAMEPSVRSWLYYEYDKGYGAHSGGQIPRYFYINKTDFDSPSTWKHWWLRRLMRQKLIKVIPMTISDAKGIDDVITASEIIKLDADAIENYFSGYNADGGENEALASAVYDAEKASNDRSEILIYLDGTFVTATSSISDVSTTDLLAYTVSEIENYLTQYVTDGGVNDVYVTSLYGLEVAEALPRIDLVYHFIDNYTVAGAAVGDVTAVKLIAHDTDADIMAYLDKYNDDAYTTTVFSAEVDAKDSGSYALLYSILTSASTFTIAGLDTIMTGNEDIVLDEALIDVTNWQTAVNTDSHATILFTAEIARETPRFSVLNALEATWDVTGIDTILTGNTEVILGENKADIMTFVSNIAAGSQDATAIVLYDAEVLGHMRVELIADLLSTYTVTGAVIGDITKDTLLADTNANIMAYLDNYASDGGTNDAYALTVWTDELAGDNSVELLVYLSTKYDTQSGAFNTLEIAPADLVTLTDAEINNYTNAVDSGYVNVAYAELVYQAELAGDASATVLDDLNDVAKWNLGH